MNYVTINKDYKIKVDYVMVDDINLYIVFSLQYLAMKMTMLK